VPTALKSAVKRRCTKGLPRGGVEFISFVVKHSPNVSKINLRLSLLQIGTYELCLDLLIFIMHDDMKPDLSIKH
jgi:hypothetical protein